jgi:hypothetical protein
VGANVTLLLNFCKNFFGETFLFDAGGCFGVEKKRMNSGELKGGGGYF